ncbi:EFR1 family ferrodoxin [Lachnospiraceae bacterium LCP25S3_G4]
MIGIYFSGTGNTKFCVERFLTYYESNAKAFSIEDGHAAEEIERTSEIVFAYPVYFSNMPKIVFDFIEGNCSLFSGKKIFVIATMGLFSGDGTGCSARLFIKYGANITGGLHLKMPDCIGDEKALKRTKEQNHLLVTLAENKIKEAAESLKFGRPVREGLGFGYHMAGLFGQRLWFYNKTKKYSDKLCIKREKCIGCGICVSACPMDNIQLHSGKAKQQGMCTMCYRCVNHCPKQAITLLGKKIYEQCTIEKYL